MHVNFLNILLRRHTSEARSKDWPRCSECPRLMIHSEHLGQSLDRTKVKDIVDDDFKFDENGREFSERVENTHDGKRCCSLRAIAPFPAVFSKFL